MIEYKKEAERKVFKVSDLRFFTPYWKLDKISKKININHIYYLVNVNRYNNKYEELVEEYILAVFFKEENTTVNGTCFNAMDNDLFVECDVPFKIIIDESDR